MKTFTANKLLITQIIFVFICINNIKSQTISLPIKFENYISYSTKNAQQFKNPIQPVNISLDFLDKIYDSVYKTDNYKKSVLQIKPLINNAFYSNISDGSFFHTGNGLGITYIPSKKLSFDLNYTYNYISLPAFAEKKIDSTLIIPHYSKAEKSNQHYYFHNLVGELLYSPSSFLNFSLGNKHTFLGNGYRSLFLSDNSCNFLSLKANVNIWNIDYFFQTSFLKDIHKVEQPYELKKKYGTFHFISWDVTPKFNLNFFESVIWAPDDSTINRGYDINYLNPVVFLRPVEFSVGSPDNILLGLGSNVEIFPNTLLYSQLILDEFNLSYARETEKWWANKFGYQFGIKYWKINKNYSLIFNLEHNWMRPFTFSHAYTSKSYGNMLQPLGHPLGSNFKEWISSFNISKKKLFVENVLAFQQYGTDSISTNYGNNIYKSNDNRSLDYGSEILQGVKNNVLINQLTMSYLIIPKWFSFIDFGITYRYHKFDNIKENDLYFSIGLRTGIKRRNIFDSKY